MVATLLALALATTAQLPDTLTYANEPTARLISLARGRHAVQDTLVHDYEALVRTRVDAGFGRSRFARVLPIVAVETAARVTWARPNDLRVTILGVRSASALRGAKVEAIFSDPWFVPRGLGDSIHFVDREIPETGALHPLAPGADAFYRYAIFDSLTIELPGRSVRAVGIRVDPKRMGPSLVAGNLWLDAETAEVVRLTFFFLGDYLWSAPDSETASDSARARKDNARASRILRVEAELEYALHESRYWMPYRQLVILTVDLPLLVSGQVPVRFVTHFSDYRINRGVSPVFTVALDDTASRARARCRRRAADTLCVRRGRDANRRAQSGYTRAERWNSGRWELEVLPRDSLGRYAWPDHLALAPDAATEQMIREAAVTLARVDQGLPAEWAGRHVFGVAYERFSDFFRYNRVQGVSVGAGFQIRLGPGFTSLLGTARFGISDERAMGSLGLRRDAPGGRLDIGAWRTMREAEPWTAGLGLGNSLNAIFAGHDDADYHLTLGGGVSFLGNSGLTEDAELALRFERVRSVATAARSVVNDWLGGSGRFQPNPGVVAGDFVEATIAQRALAGPLEARYGVEGVAGVGGGAGGLRTARLWATAKVRFGVAGRGGTLSLKAGGTVGDSVPQLMFRVGGPETVGGYTYGTTSGRSMWSAQLDVALSRGGVISPVVFADAGNTTFSGDPLVGVGAGVSFLGGLVRFNLAKGLNPTAGVRFDLLFRPPR